MALDLVPLNIRVNSVAPGATLTGMTERTFSDPDVRGKYEKATPIGRIASPSDIAKVVIFLLSDESSYITGETIVADGGFAVSK